MGNMLVSETHKGSDTGDSRLKKVKKVFKNLKPHRKVINLRLYSNLTALDSLEWKDKMPDIQCYFHVKCFQGFLKSGAFV